MESSRRDVSNYRAEHKSTLKKNQNTTHVWFSRLKKVYKLPNETGVPFLLCTPQVNAMPRAGDTAAGGRVDGTGDILWGIDQQNDDLTNRLSPVLLTRFSGEIFHKLTGILLFEVFLVIRRDVGCKNCGTVKKYF